MLNKRLIPAPWTQRAVPGGKFMAKLGPVLLGRPKTETADTEAPLWGLGMEGSRLEGSQAALVFFMRLLSQHPFLSEPPSQDGAQP